MQDRDYRSSLQEAVETLNHNKLHKQLLNFRICFYTLSFLLFEIPTV